MKNVLMLYPNMLFYKVAIFNKLSDYLRKSGYNLIIWYRRMYDPFNECHFNHIDYKMTRNEYKRVIKEYKTDIIINILFKKDPGIFFYFFSILYAKFHNIPVLYYGHGFHLQKNQSWRDFLYNLTYLLFDGIILYSPKEKNRLWKFYHNKVTFAINTLDIEDTRVAKKREQIKQELNITEQKIILTTGRLHSRKKIKILSDIFLKNYSDSSEVAWIIVGPDLSNEIKTAIMGIKNIYYLGPIYEKQKIAEIFSIADIYCVPGALGLGIVEAIYWGLPIVTMNVNHGPEAFLLRNKENALVARDKEELENCIKEILVDDDRRNIFSINAKKIFFQEATLDKMFTGFVSQLTRFY